MKSKFLELEADVGSASDEGEDEEREIYGPAKESESYTADQLKPKAARLTKTFIDDIESRYVNQAEDEESPAESEDDSDQMGDVGNDRTVDRNSFDSKPLKKPRKLSKDDQERLEVQNEIT